MNNVTVDSVNAKFDSFLVLQAGVVVWVTDSSFTNTNWYEEGSVLFAGTKLTHTTITNTIFENNTALLGGVMFIEQQSVVNWTNWTFNNNFAVEGGVIAVSTDGYFIFEQSQFTNNFAIAGLVVNIFISAIESRLVTSTITNNIFVDSGLILSEINNNCSLLWFISNDFKIYLQNNTEVLDVFESTYAITSIFGNIKAIQTNVSEQDQFVNAYSSTVSLEQVNIQNVNLTDPVIKASLSVVNGSSIIVNSVSNLGNSSSPFISCSIDSTINLNSLNYTKSEASMFLLTNVTGQIQNI